jgi:hypothetical protein
MSEERDANVQEFKLEPDCELRFEVESKNEKVILEVSYTIFDFPNLNLRKCICYTRNVIHLSSYVIADTRFLSAEERNGRGVWYRTCERKELCIHNRSKDSRVYMARVCY